MDEVKTAYYLRMQAQRPARGAGRGHPYSGRTGISIEAMLQKEPPGRSDVPIIMLTQRVSEQNMNQAIAKIEALDAIEGSITRIRMEHLHSNWK